MHIVHGLLAGLALLSIGLCLWQWWAGFRFPLHQKRIPTSISHPSVTVIKPLKGTDDFTAKCLRSWIEQEYSGPIQILFVVHQPHDPASEMVRQFCLEFPNRDLQLLVVPDLAGTNAKISKVNAAYQIAKYELVVVSDADVLAPGNLLSDICEVLSNQSVGLVNCFYELAAPSRLGMKWEALCINSDFWSQVLQSNMIQPMKFALGAVMGTRCKVLEKMGGFSSLKDLLADDYELGKRVYEAGFKIELLQQPVQCLEMPFGWNHAWKHQLRWAQTIRACQPGPYFLSILNNLTLWNLLYFLWMPGHHSVKVLACALFVRCSASWLNYRKLTRSGPAFAFFLAPIKDLLSFGIWTLSLFHNQVVWRGENYRLLRGGILKKI